MSQAAIIRTGEGSPSKLRDLSAEMLANAINRGGARNSNVGAMHGLVRWCILHGPR